jgi:hypothetical protein
MATTQASCGSLVLNTVWQVNPTKADVRQTEALPLAQLQNLLTHLREKLRSFDERSLRTKPTPHRSTQSTHPPATGLLRCRVELPFDFGERSWDSDRNA